MDYSAGPLCLEKVPGRTEREVATNMGSARQWMVRVEVHFEVHFRPMFPPQVDLSEQEGLVASTLGTGGAAAL